MAPLTPAQKLSALRDILKKNDLDALIVPSADSHNSEYPSDHHKRRQYISNFTGSAGTAVITAKEALLWTDGRYFVQAANELDSSLWTLMKEGEPDSIRPAAWLKKETNGIKVVGSDAYTISASMWKDVTAHGKLEFKSTESNLVDQVWAMEPDVGSQQPAIPAEPITEHPMELAGYSVAEKLKDLRTDMKGGESGAGDVYDVILLTDTMEVAWIFNLRGDDFRYNPMFLSFALITSETVTLYCHDNKLTDEARKHLQANNIAIKHYDAIVGDMQVFGKRNKLFVMDPNVNLEMYLAVEDTSNITLKISSVCIAKSKKNEVEISCFKEGHIQDAVALCTYFCWIEAGVADGSILNEDEVSASDYLEKLRRQQPGNLGLSFGTISSIDANAAINHYNAPKVGSKKFTHGIYLCDSGGQYRGCTTDVTRTLHLGTPTPIQSECWTRVLKGHLQLARAVFPKTTKGPQLDIMARKFLWDAGLNFSHGTGHGVGAYLSVHEGPISITPFQKSGASEVGLDKGMVVSNEPGYYLADHWGIRHENLVHVVQVELKSNHPLPVPKSGTFFGFENLTLVPFQKKFAMMELLTNEEIDQLDAYHKRTWETISPRIKDSNVLEWLKQATLSWK